MTPSGIELTTFGLVALCLNQLPYNVHNGFWLQGLMERDHVKDPGIKGRILKWIFNKWVGEHGLD